MKPGADEPNEPFGETDAEDLSLIREFLLFIRENKKYWLVPIILCPLLLGLAIALGGSPAAPFIYTLF